MGAEVYPVFRPRLPGVEFKGSGKPLLREFEALDEIARRVSVPEFSSYGDQPDEEGEDSEPWFDPKDGLLTVKGLIGALRDPENRALTSEPDHLLEALQELERCLGEAATRAVRFRLEVS